MGNNLGTSTIRHNAQFRCRPKGQGWSASTGSVQKKNVKMRFGGKWSLIGKVSQFCSEKIHDDTDSRFVFKVHGNRLREVGETMRCSCDKKIAKCGFSPPFCASSAEAPKVCMRVPREPTSPCKSSSQSVPICWSYSRKGDFARPQYNRPTCTPVLQSHWSFISPPNFIQVRNFLHSTFKVSYIQ